MTVGYLQLPLPLPFAMVGTRTESFAEGWSDRKCITCRVGFSSSPNFKGWNSSPMCGLQKNPSVDIDTYPVSTLEQLYAKLVGDRHSPSSTCVMLTSRYPCMQTMYTQQLTHIGASSNLELFLLASHPPPPSSSVLWR